MKVKKLSSDEWQINMSDEEAMTYVMHRLGVLIRISELMNPLAPKPHINEFLVGLTFALKNHVDKGETLKLLKEKEPLLISLILEQTKESSPPSTLAPAMSPDELMTLMMKEFSEKEKPIPPNESDNFAA